MSNIYAANQCSIVENGAVTTTGRFRDLIRPAATLSTGIAAAAAASRYGAYLHSRHSETAGYQVVDAEPWYDAGDDAVYTTTRVALTLDELKAEKKTAIEAERDRRIYTPIAAVDIKGDGSVMVEPDIRNQGDRDNLGDLHSRALEMHVAGVTTAVIPFTAADNTTHVLTPIEMLLIASTVFDRGSALHSRGRVLKTANADASNAAGVALINVSTGAINGEGAWPT